MEQCGVKWSGAWSPLVEWSEVWRGVYSGRGVQCEVEWSVEWSELQTMGGVECRAECRVWSGVHNVECIVRCGM